jgi:hypothetical protein
LIFFTLRIIYFPFLDFYVNSIQKNNFEFKIEDAKKNYYLNEFDFFSDLHADTLFEQLHRGDIFEEDVDDIFKFGHVDIQRMKQGFFFFIQKN